MAVIELYVACDGMTVKTIADIDIIEAIIEDILLP